MAYWNDDDFRKVVLESTTITQVLREFEIPTNQGHYNKMFHADVKRLGINTDHFGVAKCFYNSYPIEDVFVKDSKWKSGSSYLKKKAFRHNLLKNECSECKLSPTWKGKSLTLQLDHINGDPKDNSIENLRILCPNCHSQTTTFSGAKKRKEKHAYKFVCKCGSKKLSASSSCNSCANRKKNKAGTNLKIKWPEPQVVLKLVKDTNFVSVGKKLGVSDNAVRKFLKRHDLL